MAESTFCAGCLRDDENNTGEAWCCDCAKLVCKTCSSCHKKLYPPHTVIPLEKVSSLSSSLLKLSRYCQFHTDQKIVLFCCQHDQLVCDSCVSTSHQNCKPVNSIAMAAKGVQTGTAVTGLEKRMDNLTRIMGNIMSIYNTELSNLGEQKKNIKKEVADIKTNIVSHLDKLETDFNTELDSKFNKCRQQFTMNDSDIHCRYDKLMAWKENIKSLKDYTSNVPLFHAIKYLDAKTHRDETEFRKFKTDVSIPKVAFKQTEEISKIHDTLSSFGILILDTSSITSPSDLDIDQQGQVVVRSEVQSRQLSLLTSFETSKLGDVQIHSGCFVPDKKLLLCYYYYVTNTMGCTKKNIHGQSRTKVSSNVYLSYHDGSDYITIKLDNDTYDVTLYDRNTALVSAGRKGFQIIDLNTLQAGKLINVGDDCGRITSLNGKIWASSGDCTLTMIDINGNVEKDVWTSFNPYNICLTKSGNIYCTGVGTDDVYIVTSDGEESVVYNSPNLGSPIGITADDHGDVYIAGNDSHNIHRISSDGQQSNIILTEEDGINYPTGLSFNHQTKELMVVNNDDKCININKVS